MSEEILTDFRWGTQSTKLASALLVLDFRLTDQPFTAVCSAENASRGFAYKIWFVPSKPKAETVTRSGKPDSFKFCQGVMRLWEENKEDKKHPEVFWMRRGLETRDWLIKDFRNRKFLRHQISNLWVSTGNLKCAAAVASIIEPTAFCDKVFYFPAKAVELIHEFGNSEGESRIQWVKAVIEQQDILISRINGPNHHKQISVRNERLDRTLVMPANANSELKRNLLRALEKP